MKMTGFVGVLSIITFLSSVGVIYSQAPCTPKDAGPYLAVPPVLLMSVFEANKEDLTTSGNSNKYKSELRLYGTINSQSSDGIEIHMLDDYQFLDPKEHFVAETDAVVGKSYFRLTRPLDRDGPTEALDDDTNFITFSLKCVVKNTTTEKFYQVRIMIEDENDNYPQFIGTPYQVEVGELQAVGTTVFRVSAIDKDLNLDGGLKYEVIASDHELLDATPYFQINDTTGDVSIKNALNFEMLMKDHKYFILNVKVTDSDMLSPKSSQTALRIDITDGDDNGPAFFYDNCIMYKNMCLSPLFTAITKSLAMNVPLITYPYPNMGNAVHIQARDMDPSRSMLLFSIIATQPVGYENDFKVETVTSGDYYAAVIKPMNVIPQDVLRAPLRLFVKAEEQTSTMRYAVATIEFMEQKSGGSTDNTSDGQSAGQNEVNKTPTDKEEYTDRTIALIVVVAILATLLLTFMCVTVILLRRRKGSKKSESVSMGAINRGYE